MQMMDIRFSSLVERKHVIVNGGLLVLTGIVLLLATGCGSTTHVPHGDYRAYTEVSEAAGDETARIRLRDGRLLVLKGLVVGPDSASGWAPTGKTRAFPTSSIRTVTLTSRGAGFWQGAGLGAASVIAVGLIVGSFQETEISGDLMTGGGLVLSIPAGLVTGLVGAGTGAKTVYRFTGPSQPERSRPDRP